MNVSLHRLISIACLIGLCGLVGLPVQGEFHAADGTSFPAGDVVERVSCLDDPETTYAVYLPSSYNEEREWPVLFIMDPRGRARFGMDRFQPAAERLGYILISSYDTRSDVPRDSNIQAVKALLPEAERRFSINPRRLYLTGFSGTARTAWVLALALKGYVAGIIGIGGGLPGSFDPADVPIVFFGGAGTEDFNYEEMQRLDGQLDSTKIVHRFAVWSGGHDWAPGEVCEDALEWMELQAMATRLTAKDDAFIEAQFHAGLAEGQAMVEDERFYDALVHYRALAASFLGLREGTEALTRAQELEKRPDVRRETARRERFSDEYVAYRDRFFVFVDGLRRKKTVREGKIPGFLKIPDLKERAAAESDLPDAEAARRMLATIQVQTSFYLPQEFLAAGRFKAALAVLQIADAIRPDNPQVCQGRAQALAQLERSEEALEALRCLIAAYPVDPLQLEADAYLAPLHSEPGYQELIKKLTGPTGG